MKIGMLVTNYLPRQGGAEYAVHHLTTALKRLGHEVVVLMEHDPSAHHLHYPYPVSQCLRIPWISSAQKRWLQTRYEFARKSFDVLHVHVAWSAAGEVCAKFKRHATRPVVITPHGGDVQVLPEIEYGMCLDPHVAKGIRATLQTADLVTAVSHRMQSAIMDRGVEMSRIRDVGYGTEFEAIQRLQTQDLRTQIGWSPSDFVVLSVGRNSRVKDIPTFIEGFRLAAAQQPSLRCLLAGPDESIREMVMQTGLENRAKMLGRIPSGYDPKHPTDMVFQTPYPELIAAYRACDVYVSTSYIESFNTSALDAFSCGKTVIVTNTQGFMDVLEEGVNGCSIPPNNPQALAEQILRLSANRPRCRQMGEAARRTASEFDWLKVAQRYVGVYEDARRMFQSTTA